MNPILLYIKKFWKFKFWDSGTLILKKKKTKRFVCYGRELKKSLKMNPILKSFKNFYNLNSEMVTLWSCRQGSAKSKYQRIFGWLDRENLIQYFYFDSRSTEVDLIFCLWICIKWCWSNFFFLDFDQVELIRPAGKYFQCTHQTISYHMRKTVWWYLKSVARKVVLRFGYSK